MYSKKVNRTRQSLVVQVLLAVKIYRHDCEKNVKMNFRLWRNRGFLGKINCIFTITSKDSGHSGTVQVPVS